MLTVVGYSERGMVNGLVGFLREDNWWVAQFIQAWGRVRLPASEPSSY